MKKGWYKVSLMKLTFENAKAWATIQGYKGKAHKKEVSKIMKYVAESEF